MNLLHRTKVFACAALAGLGILSAQDRFRMADPLALTGGSGWNVSPSVGGTDVILPVGAVPGEIPIPVVLRMNATHVIQVNHLWTGYWVWDYNSDGLRYKRWQQDDGGQSYHDRPMFATMHFGYIDAGASYDGVTEKATYVLEDGRQFRLQDLYNFSTYMSATFNLPQAYGFGAKAATNVLVTTDGHTAVYTASGTELGNWQSKLQSLAPTGYGAAPTQYTLIMDKGIARVYAYVSAFNASIPLLWMDRFGHTVEFHWTQSTAGLPAGVTSVHTVQALNQRGKGVQVAWSVQGATSTEVDLLRTDFVGVAAPSLYVKGYGGMATVRPTAMTGLPTSQGTILPDVAGLVGRPTQIQMGMPGSLPVPVWSGAAPARPTPAPYSGPAVPTTT